MFDARHVQIAGTVSKPEEMSASVVSVDGDEITLEEGQALRFDA
jgi:hypothetical protein